MKVKLLTIISILSYQLSISQTEKLVHGKVFSQNTVLKGVEVINKTAKTSTRTDEMGDFAILANEKDSLIFFSKNYFFKRLKLTAENIESNNLIVTMILKPEELEEVVITKIKFPKVNYDPDAFNKINLEKSTQNLTRFIPGYNDGTITNGINFAALGGGLLALLKKDNKEPKQKAPDTDFKKLVYSTCPPDFFTKDLKLAPDQKELFIEFCDADPRSKLLLEHPNVLSLMDFMYNKCEVFKKLE